MSEIELKPCPFCGGNPTFEETITERSIRCDNCSANIVRDTKAVLPQHVWNARQECDRETADLRERLEAYEQMFARARQVEFRFASAVRITTYPASNKVTLHYRDRKGGWLNDPLVDTDFTGERKWKAFNSPLEAFAALTKLQESK